MKHPFEARKKRAVAITYRKDLPAPLVLARGFGHIAEAITDSAKLAGVPIIKDDEISDALVRIDAGDMIPESAYRVVAELLAFVYSLDTSKG
jgi:flagellar biosynthesis protein